MCILFIHNGSNVPESDYRLIVASNRDELLDRPAANIAPWTEDPAVVGGRDLEIGCDGGTWLAISPLRKKIGALLNLPAPRKYNAKTRGKLVADFVKSDSSAQEYVESIKEYATQCNNFNFVAIDLGSKPNILTFDNLTNKLRTWKETEFGISNSLLEHPLKKVEGGKQKLKEICNEYNKIGDKSQLLEKLLELLKSREQHLPDPIFEKNRPTDENKEYSSICVCIPQKRYGTRTHTIILVTKTGHVDIIEITLQAPIDLENPNWQRTEMQFDL